MEMASQSATGARPRHSCTCASECASAVAFSTGLITDYICETLNKKKNKKYDLKLEQWNGHPSLNRDRQSTARRIAASDRFLIDGVTRRVLWPERIAEISIDWLYGHHDSLDSSLHGQSLPRDGVIGRNYGHHKCLRFNVRPFSEELLRDVSCSDIPNKILNVELSLNLPVDNDTVGRY
ncbi:unnamed protein product [Colias eurytheme]|nr:unnamed protein product [Colias eurytheme]